MIEQQLTNTNESVVKAKKFLRTKQDAKLTYYLCSNRDQVIFDSMRRDPVVGGVDPGIASMCHVDQQAPSDDWQQAYTSAELLSALIPSTPFPLDDQVTWHGSGPSSSTTASDCFHMSWLDSM